jgi:hypothetical protein
MRERKRVRKVRERKIERKERERKSEGNRERERFFNSCCTTERDRYIVKNCSS